MVNLEEKLVKKRNRNRGLNKKIGFTEESMTRDVAETLLSQDENKSDARSFRDKLDSESLNSGTKISTKKPKKRKAMESGENDKVRNNESSGQDIKPKKIKRNKKISKVSDTNEESKTNGDSKTTEDGEKTKTDGKSVSKRALKRQRYQELLDAKRKHSDIDALNKSLNYLSNWKHNKSAWKFEKLRQVWLVQNLYNSAKIGDLHWNTLVEYLSDAKGKVRDQILKEAIKITENDEVEEKDPEKFKRAKDVVQNLQ